MAVGDKEFTSVEWFINNSFMGAPSRAGVGLGFLKTSRFKVDFILPTIAVGAATRPQPGILRGVNKYGNRSSVISPTRPEIESFLENNIYSITMPPITVTTEVTPLRWKIGRRSEEESCVITFFESPNMAIRNTMWTWIDRMVTRRTDTNNWAREYLDDVKATITIRPIELDGNPAERAAVLTYAIPTSVQGIDFNISQGENEPGKTSVTFKYRFQEMVSRSFKRTDAGPR